jgi:hypothetical protein
MPEASYGTRCSTVMLGSVDAAGRWCLRVLERTHDREGRAVALGSVTLEAWPNRGERPPVRVQPLS